MNATASWKRTVFPFFTRVLTMSWYLLIMRNWSDRSRCSLLFNSYFVGQPVALYRNLRTGLGSTFVPVHREPEVLPERQIIEASPGIFCCDGVWQEHGWYGHI